MRRSLNTVLILALLGLSGLVKAHTEASSHPCYLDGWSSSLRCYQVAVEKGSAASAVAVMVAPAVNDSGRDPLYLLAGGPGQAASELAPLLNAFRKINRERDIVMVDRRGAGYSGAFRCGLERALPVDLQAFSRQLADCYLQRADFAESLSSRQTVSDLEQVRRYLGHQRIALWGGSWGTRTALLYQQWYPDSLSALVLDAVAPIDAKVFLTATAAERALRQLEKDCAQDPVCARFGDWRRELNLLLANWGEREAANFPDPRTGAPVEQPMARWALANAIRTALYQPTAAAQLPYAVHQAARGNLQPLSGITGQFLDSADSMAMGLMFSVACAEELSRISTEEVAADSADSFLGTAFFDLFANGCKAWPVQPKPYGKPEPREQPVLLISGDADPITPPYYAEQYLDYLAHKQHLIVSGGGHINSARGCIPDLIAHFLDAPFEPLEQECVAEIHRPPFMADAFGPALVIETKSDQQGGQL